MKNDLIPKQNYSVTVLKSSLALCLIAWVVVSGKLDLSQVWGAFHRPVPMAAGFICVLCMTLFSFVRWHVILRGLGIEFALRTTLAMGLIGNFWSTFSPGAVGGDIVKSLYASRIKKNETTAIVFSVLMDRLLALTSLCMVVVAVGFAQWGSINSQNLRDVVLAVGAVAAVFIICLGSLLACARWLVSQKKESSSSFPLANQIWTLVYSIRKLASNWRHSLVAFVLSMAISVMLGFCFLAFGLSLAQTGIGLGTYMFAGPIIVLAMSVPLTPAGIGVGQIAGVAVMSFVGIDSPTFGADLVTLVQLARATIGLLGAYVFVRLRVETEGCRQIESLNKGCEL